MGMVLDNGFNCCCIINHQSSIINHVCMEALIILRRSSFHFFLLLQWRESKMASAAGSSRPDPGPRCVAFLFMVRIALRACSAFGSFDKIMEGPSAEGATCLSGASWKGATLQLVWARRLFAAGAAFFFSLYWCGCMIPKFCRMRYLAKL